MFKFDVFEILKLSITFNEKKVYKLWYHARHSFHTKIIKKLQLALQNGAGPCDVISRVAL